VKIDWELQTKCWELQFELANKMKLPLVLHCVKSYYDFIPFCKKSTVPLLFHGFNGNSDVAKRLSVFENVYFSFGFYSLSVKSSESLINEIDPNKILLETDNSNLPISSIYELARKQLNWKDSFILEQIKMNTNRFYRLRNTSQF
jgi:TatD DNase family protein